MEMAGKYSNHYFQRPQFWFFGGKKIKKQKVLRIAWFGEKVDQKFFSFLFFFNKKFLELPDLARKLIRKTLENFSPPPLQTCAPENFRSCRWGAEGRFPRAQTPERGPPLAWAEIYTYCLAKPAIVDKWCVGTWLDCMSQYFILSCYRPGKVLKVPWIRK